MYVKEQRDSVPYISVDPILYCALRVHDIKRQINILLRYILLPQHLEPHTPTQYNWNFIYIKRQ